MGTLVSGRIEARVLFPDRKHGTRCLCLTCGTRTHPDECHCCWCSERRGVEAEFRAAGARERREPTATDGTAAHVAALVLTRRELAERVGCSLGTASRLARPGNRVRRELVERVLAL